MPYQCLFIYSHCANTEKLSNISGDHTAQGLLALLCLLRSPSFVRLLARAPSLVAAEGHRWILVHREEEAVNPWLEWLLRQRVIWNSEQALAVKAVVYCYLSLLLTNILLFTHSYMLFYSMPNSHTVILQLSAVLKGGWVLPLMLLQCSEIKYCQDQERIAYMHYIRYLLDILDLLVFCCHPHKDSTCCSEMLFWIPQF